MRIQALSSNYNSIKLATKNSANDTQRSKLIFDPKIISFSGRNPKQVALVATEAAPIAKYGGVGDVMGSLPQELNSQGLDTRLFMPMYDSDNSLKKHFGKLTYTNQDNVSFNVKATGIKADFQYGLKKGTAELYKVDDSKVPFSVYLVKMKEFSNQKAPYTGEMSAQSMRDSAFCMACLALLDKMKDTREDFNPKFLHTNDWMSAFIYANGKDGDFEDIDELKKIHTLHNAGYFYQGKIAPSIAANYVIPKEISSQALNSDDTRENIIKTNEAIKATIRTLQEALLDDEIGSSNWSGAIDKIARNHSTYEIYTPKNIEDLDYSIIAAIPREAWSGITYNPTKKALQEADFITTVSKEYLKETREVGESAPHLDREFIYATWKSTGITNGLDLDNFNPAIQNPSPEKRIAKTFSIFNYIDGKAINKSFLQNNLGRQFDRTHQNTTFNVEQYGYLENNPNAFTTMLLARFSPEQKGIDILIDSAREFLDNNPDAQLILGGPDFDKNIPLVREYINLTSEYEGRAVMLNGFVKNMNQFFAGSDAIIMPNRFAPCEILQMQAMRYGCVPIASSVGGLKEIIVGYDDDKDNATGFKTSVGLNSTSHATAELNKALSQAYRVFKNNPDTWDKIAINSMKYKRDWSQVAKEYKKEVYSNPIFNTNIERFYSVDEKLYRGSQPGKCHKEGSEFETNLRSLEKDLIFLKNQGIKTIIDFRNEIHEGIYPAIEEKQAEAMGLKYVGIPLRAHIPPTAEEIKTYINAINSTDGKVYIHCRAGIDRTGIMTCVYLAKEKGYTPEEAIQKAFKEVGTPIFQYMSQENKEKMIKILEDLRTNKNKLDIEEETPSQPSNNINDMKARLEEMRKQLERIQKGKTQNEN